MKVFFGNFSFGCGLLILCLSLGFVNIVSGQVPFDPLSSHLLETSTGIPGAGVLCKLYKKSSGQGQPWTLIGSRLTAENGRIANIISAQDFTVGTYKFWFDTAELYGRTNTTTFYPYVEVLFDVTNPTEHYHVPVLLSPFEVSAYKGFYSTPSTTTPAPVPDPLIGFLLDTLSGRPAPNVLGSLYRLQNNEWHHLISKTTSEDGVFGKLFKNSCEFIPGTYKMSFDTQSYWRSMGHDSIFPTVDVVFYKVASSGGGDAAEKLSLPILISPHSFNTYKGNSSPNPVPCL